MPVIALDDIERPPRDLPDATVVCDAYPHQYGNEFGETSIVCDADLVRLSATVLRRVTDAPIERLYLERPDCPTAPCSPTQLDTASMHVWTEDGAWTIVLDHVASTISVPVSLVGDPWPAAGGSAEPAVHRPAFLQAPPEIRYRDALPYCGRTINTMPRDIEVCFRDAVLEGRPVEMLNRSGGIDVVSDGVAIWRFEGSGAVFQYFRYEGAWSRGTAVMILNPSRFGIISLEDNGEAREALS